MSIFFSNQIRKIYFKNEKLFLTNLQISFKPKKQEKNMIYQIKQAILDISFHPTPIILVQKLSGLRNSDQPESYRWKSWCSSNSIQDTSIYQMLMNAYFSIILKSLTKISGNIFHGPLPETKTFPYLLTQSSSFLTCVIS